MWEGSGSLWVMNWAGEHGKVHKWERSGDMAFVQRGVRTLVKVAKNESRD